MSIFKDLLKFLSPFGSKGGREFLIGSKRKKEQLPRFTPEQEQALNQLRQWGMENQDPQAIEDRYTKQFRESTIPGIAEQFAGMGGGLKSSAFQGALGRAGSDLSSQLAALRSGRGMQQTQLGLSQQFDTNTVPGVPGFMQQNAGPLADLLGQMFMGQRWGQGKQGQQDQQGGPKYFGGQPQGLSAETIAPIALKLIMGMI